MLMLVEIRGNETAVADGALRCNAKSGASDAGSGEQRAKDATRMSFGRRVSRSLFSSLSLQAIDPTSW
jgi:hypothetical protein